MSNMKKQYNSITASIALALLMSACSDSEIVEVPSAETSAQVVRAIASADDTTTRVAVDDDGSFINFLWEDNDSFIVVNGTQATEFTLVDGAGDKGATFEGMPDVPYTDGETLYAVFNKKANADNNYCLDENGNMRLELNPQDGQLSNNQVFLYAEGQYSSDMGCVRFNFKSLVSIFKVEVELPDGVNTVDNISFTFGETILSDGTLVLNNPYSINGRTFGCGSMYNQVDRDDQYNNIYSAVAQNIQYKDNKVIAYFYAFPSFTTGNYYYNNHQNSYTYNVWPYCQPIIDVYANNHKYIIARSVNQREIESGKTYRIASSLIEEKDFDNEDTADGYNEPYQISTADQLYTLMYRTAQDRRNANGISYQGLKYVLTDDIELTRDLPWYGIELWYSSFDGQGHSISGNIKMAGMSASRIGLFSAVYYSNINNLKMLANISNKESNYRNYSAGAIAGEIQNATIENCSSSSIIDVNTVYLGGLVGYSRSDNKIIGCTFSGTMKNDLTPMSGNWNNYYPVGGIVGFVQEPTSVIGCYSNGRSYIDYAGYSITDPLCHGGIVGVIGYRPGEYWYDNTNTNITGCYASVPLTIDIATSDANLYFGGIVGYGTDGTMTNCYWDYNVATYATSDTNMSQNNCATYTGEHPSAEQIAAMNAAIAGCGYKYDENGKIIVDQISTIDPFEKEEW